MQEQRCPIKAEIDARIIRVLDHGCSVLAPKVADLEELVADFSGARNCIRRANGIDVPQTEAAGRLVVALDQLSAGAPA